MFSRLSLRYRIALMIFVLNACVLAAVLSFTLFQSRQTASDFDSASQQASLDLLGELSIAALLTGEYADYQVYIQNVQKQPSIGRIVLADRHHRVVASSAPGDVGRLLDEAVRGAAPGWRVQPVQTAAGALGTLAVRFSDAALTAAYQRTRNLALMIAATGMLLIALVGLVAGVALTRRLERVAHAVRRFAEGRHDTHSGVVGGDEVAVLARDFDRMADAVARQQRQLKQQGDYIELLLDSTAEAIYGVDTNGVCTFVNPACLRMLGYERESDLVGKILHALIHHTYPDGRPYPMEECAVRHSTFEGRPAHADDEVHWRADGSSFPVEYWSHPMHRDGTLIGAVVTFVDITERKRAEGELRRYREDLEQMVERRTAELGEANRELQAFSYSVSHDLRAPLRAIDGFAQALVEDYADKLDTGGRDYLMRVRAGAHRMGLLIDDMLEMSRASLAEMRAVEVDLGAMAAEILGQLAAAAPGRRVTVAIAPDLVAHGDARLLHIVLTNLLDNAWKYTGKTAAARIEFDSEAVNGERMFRVRDNGAGFDMGHAGKLFGVFQRLHRRDEFEGTGIGLATVQRIVVRHGGRVWAEAAPGQGATFHFTLAGGSPAKGDAS